MKRMGISEPSSLKACKSYSWGSALELLKFAWGGPAAACISRKQQHVLALRMRKREDSADDGDSYGGDEDNDDGSRW